MMKTNRQKAPCRFRTDLPQMSDLVFWTEWACYCEHFVFIPEVLAQYRLDTEGANETSINCRNLQAWVLDEWKAMGLIHHLINGGGPGLLKRLLLKTVFAARSSMKMKLVQEDSPEYSLRIEQESRRISGALCWQFGKFAAGLKSGIHYLQPKDSR